MKRVLLMGLVGFWGVALAEEKYPDGMTILETPKNGETQVATGSGAEMDVAREPASTFKVVIAWAGFERVGGERDILWNESSHRSDQ